jgi:hypothetical protein
MNSDRLLLRHLLATLAYRATRALDNAPQEFAEFGDAGRQPVQIVAHIGDLLDWALSMASGNPRWQNSAPLAWPAEVERFYAALKAFDSALESADEIHAPIDRLIQGPVADALTHVGQLAMLRRMAGCATHGENFYVAEITIGQTGPDQAPPIRTF